MFSLGYINTPYQAHNNILCLCHCRNDWNKDCSPKQENRSDKRSIQGSKDHQTRVEGFELIKQSTQDKLVEETDPINTKSNNQEEGKIPV